MRRLPSFPLPVLLVLAVVGATVRAASTGPVPPPTDAFGRTGPFTVETRTFPSPGFPGQVVTVFSPVGTVGPRPTWFFAHGFNATDPALYLDLLHHLAGHGWSVVFSPYPANGTADTLYDIIFDGFAAAARRYPATIDTRRVGFGGHSYGGGATPALALRAFRELGWGRDARCLFILAPWYSSRLTNADLASFPAGTQAVVQVYEDDLVNDHRMAIDLFRNLALPAADKDYLFVRSDLADGYAYNASHLAPNSPRNPGSGNSTFDALDTWGVLRIAQALSASSFSADARGRAVALGDGSALQTQMGTTPGGRALRPMVATDDPLPLFPASHTQWQFSQAINPRRALPPPEYVATARISSLSARVFADSGDSTLILGATITGAQPKSLLIRAVGPSLTPFNVTGVMPDPLLTVYRGATVDLANNQWSEAINPPALETAQSEAGTFPLPANSRDSALVASFAPGGLTATIQPATGSPGVALLEVYNTDLNSSTRLDNLSVRARVGTGEDLLIVGFAIAGGPIRLLIRGIGPALGAFNVGGVLADPQLVVYRDTTIIASNDNWSVQSDPAALAAAAAQAGTFPLSAGSADAGLLLTLAPGSYTAQIRGANSTTGNALVEIYSIP